MLGWSDTMNHALYIKGPELLRAELKRVTKEHMIMKDPNLIAIKTHSTHDVEYDEKDETTSRGL